MLARHKAIRIGRHTARLCPLGRVVRCGSQVSLLVQVAFHFNWVQISAICLQDKAEERERKGRQKRPFPALVLTLTLVSYTIGMEYFKEGSNPVKSFDKGE